MDQTCISECNKLIKKYKVYKNKTKKEEIRNVIFEKMYLDITKWISAILSDRKMYLEKNEITSMSWDCFCCGLDGYKDDNKIPLPNHFYTYTKFHLLSTIFNNKKNISLDDENSNIENTTKELQDNWANSFEMISELNEFKNSLPDKYKEVFMDALLSMSNWTVTRTRNVNTNNFTFYRYDEAKKVFKLVIKYMLNGK